MNDSEFIEAAKEEVLGFLNWNRANKISEERLYVSPIYNSPQGRAVTISVPFFDGMNYTVAMNEKTGTFYFDAYKQYQEY